MLRLVTPKGCISDALHLKHSTAPGPYEHPLGRSSPIHAVAAASKRNTTIARCESWAPTWEEAGVVASYVKLRHWGRTFFLTDSWAAAGLRLWAVVYETRGPYGRTPSSSQPRAFGKQAAVSFRPRSAAGQQASAQRTMTFRRPIYQAVGTASAWPPAAVPIRNNVVQTSKSATHGRDRIYTREGRRAFLFTATWGFLARKDLQALGNSHCAQKHGVERWCVQ